MILPAIVLAAAVNLPLSVSFVPQAKGAFALTFDGDEETHGTVQLLALLRQRHVRATLFVTGRFAELHPEILRTAVADGHEIGNHTYSHPHLTSWARNHRHDTLPGITRARVQSELLRAAAAIERAIGRPPIPFWRAPYGEHNAQIREWAHEIGYTQIGWTQGDGDALDALDWVDDPRSRRFLGPEAMARHLLGFERRTGIPLAGSIILMHLGSGRPEPPLLETLPILLDETDRRGLRAVPVSELMKDGGMAAEGVAVDR